MCDPGTECEILTIGTTARCSCGGKLSVHMADYRRRNAEPMARGGLPWRCDKCGVLCPDPREDPPVEVLHLMTHEKTINYGLRVFCDDERLYTDSLTQAEAKIVRHMAEHLIRYLDGRYPGLVT